MKDLHQTFIRFSPAIFSQGLTILKSREDAEDLVQDVFSERLPRIIEQYPHCSDEELGRILITSARNLALDRYRRQRRMRELVESNPVDLCQEPVQSEDSSQVLEDLALLAKAQQEVLLLKYVAKQTWQQIAMHSGLSIQGARKRAATALDAMRKIYKDRKNEE
jgi:RNA polymerase sigma factor (sigma-70 family)